MATLEVHDDRGHVRRVEITHEHPILFGSSPKCDVVLTGAGVLPFHGRLRWRASRYKADASPDAQYLLINGHKMASASFRQGDEIRVGPCRIFLLYADDDLPKGDDKTRVQEPPVASPAQRFEKANWVDKLTTPRERTGTTVAEPESRQGAERSGRAARAPKKERQVRRPATFWSVLFARDRAPGQERIISSPLVLGLVGSLAILLFLSVSLKGIIDRTTAARLYQRAVEDFDNGDYRNAVKRFDDFLASNPKDKRGGKARVLRALSEVRQFTAATGASWPHALEAERAMIDEFSADDPAFRDSSADLADEIVKTGEAFADRAKGSADSRALEEAESALALHARLSGSAAGALLAKTRLPAKLAAARAAVRKAEVRARALAAMDAALKAGSSTGAYAARDSLVREYADLADDRDLIERITKANDLIRRAVAFDPSRRPAETEPRRDPFGPPVSLVIRSTEGGPPSAASPPVVHALADGFAYGLNATNGAPLWHVPVGLSAPFAPQSISDGASALVVDARHDELTRIDARTGALVWRQDVGEAVDDPPLVLGNQIIQTTPGGKLLLIDLKSGELRGTLNLGLRVARTPVSDEAGQFLYVLAEKDCLFILKRDPLGCVAVEYLGHRAGSIPAPPARQGRFLVVPENHALTESRWRVLVLSEDGARARPAQQISFPGWIWGTPATVGSVIWSNDDRSGVSAFAIGSYEEKNPFRLLARLNPEPRSSGPSFALARSERELWVGSGRPARYDLNPEKGSISRSWTLIDSGPALAPLQAAGALMVLTQQSVDRPGVSLWGLDPPTGSVRWRTDLGAPWPVALAATAKGDGLSSVGIDGRPLEIARQRLTAGGFVEVPAPAPGKFRLPAGRLLRFESEGLSLIVPGPGADHLLARAGGGEFRRIELPTSLGAAPLLWGRDVLVPGSDGRAYLLDPLTGESRAEPLVPPFDRAHPTRWKAPVALEGNAVALADASGKVRRLSRVNDPRPRLAITHEVNLGKEIVANPASTGAAVVLATADGRVRSLAGRDLSPAGAWPLESALAPPLSAVAGRCFVADKSRGILALGPDGGRLWSITLEGSAAAGPPVVNDQAVWFLTRDGSLQGRSLADGSPIGRVDLAILPAGGPLALGTDFVVPVAPGTLRLLAPQALATPKAGK